ncbi:MAG: hypothetical protein ACRDDY_02565 [Clostridium sp.]|uniref:hypothetical protein n=1 Tax=Clostridium sp. TaxID=1506 RepID=UPI003EE73E8C
MGCKKLLFNKKAEEVGGEYEEVATTGDSLGSLSEILPVVTGIDISSLENGTVIAEFLYITNNSGRSPQLAMRLTEGSSTNSLSAATYKTTTGEELVMLLKVTDNASSRIGVELYKNGALIETMSSVVAAKSYCAISRVTPAAGNIKVKRYLI